MNENLYDIVLAVVFVLIAIGMIVLGLLRKKVGYDSKVSQKLQAPHFILLRTVQVIFWTPMVFLIAVLIAALYFLTIVTI